MGFMPFPIVVEFLMPLVHSWVELILILADYKYKPCSLCISLPLKVVIPSRFWCLLEFPLAVQFVWLVGSGLGDV